MCVCVCVWNQAANKQGGNSDWLKATNHLSLANETQTHRHTDTAKHTHTLSLTAVEARMGVKVLVMTIISSMALSFRCDGSSPASSARFLAISAACFFSGKSSQAQVDKRVSEGV